MYNIITPIFIILGFHSSGLIASQIEPLSHYNMIVFDDVSNENVFENNRLVITNLNGTNSSYILSSTSEQEYGAVISGSFHSTVQVNNGYYIVLGGSHDGTTEINVDGVILFSSQKQAQLPSLFDPQHFSLFFSDMRIRNNNHSSKEKSSLGFKTPYAVISSFGKYNDGQSLAYHFIDKARQTLNSLPVPLQSLTNSHINSVRIFDDEDNY